MMFNGIQVRVVPPRKVRIRRRWKERLFSRPWKPLVSHNTELHYDMEKGKFYYLRDQNTLMVRQDEYANFLAQIPERTDDLIKRL